MEMKTKHMIQMEIEKIQDEPLRTLFTDDRNLFIEFLEQETDMDWARFLQLVQFVASEYCSMYHAFELWGDE